MKINEKAIQTKGIQQRNTSFQLYTACMYLQTFAVKSGACFPD